MTITEKSSRKVIVGAGWVNPLTHDYKVENAAYVHVFADDYELVQGVDYSVSGVGGAGGYSVTITVPATWAPDVWVLDARPPVDQGKDLTSGGTFGVKYMDGLDKLALRVQRVYDLAKRAVKVPISVGVEYALPVALAGSVIGWNAAGDALENKTLASIGAVVVLDDALLAAASHVAIPSQYAVKGYIDSRVNDVRNYGTIGTGSDATVFQAAIDALPATGGRIYLPPLAYVLNTQPAEGTKSVYWDIAPGATFSGAGTGLNKFATMVTNGYQLAVGPYIKSQSGAAAPATGGIAAFNVEMLQPTTYGQYSVGIYAGAKSASAVAGAGLWAANFLVAAMPGATGFFNGLEIDVNDYAAGANINGLFVTGVGTVNPQRGIAVTRSDTTRWAVGVLVSQATNGIEIQPSEATARGLVIEAPALNVTGVAGTAISARQFANNADTIFLQRFTDAAPTGYFFRGVNAANSQNMFIFDVTGNLTLAGSMLTGLAIQPSVNDGAALGSAALEWSDIFLASGAVVNFNNGDVLITHAANQLQFTLAGSGYVFDAVVAPTANDQAALGSATFSWSDLFLASGGVVNFANGNYTITHVASTSLLFGGTGTQFGVLNTASSVNYLTVAGSATSVNPIMTVGGTDTDRSVVIRGKGIGGVSLQDGASVVKMAFNATGIGFFAAPPVAKQTVGAALSTGGAETNVNLATRINDLRTALINYGLAA